MRKTEKEPAANLTPNIGGDGLNVHHTMSPELPTFGEYAKATLITAICASASAVSLYLNVTFGMMFAPILAFGFGLGDVSFFGSSLVVRQSKGWRVKLRLVQLVGLVAVIVAAGFHLYEIFDQRSSDAAQVAGRIEMASQNAETARKELDRIEEFGDVTSLQTQYSIKKAAADADAARGNCGTEVKRVTFLACQALQEEAAKLQERIGAAKRRDELTEARKAAEATVTGTEAKADAMTSFAKFIGVDKNTLFLGVMALVLTILITCSSLAEEAGEMWADIWAKRKAYYAARAPQEAPVTPVTEAFTPVKQVSKQDAAFNWVRGQIMMTPSRELEISGITMAKNLKVAPSTFATWVNRWIKEGKLERVKQGNKAIFSIPATKSTKTRRVA